MSLQIVDYAVAFLGMAKRASGLPHVSSWEEAKVSDKRCKSLASCKPGSGHSKFLNGITVFVVIRANHAFWLQWMEYGYVWHVSSTSKMHTFPQSNESEIEALPIGFKLTQAHVLNYESLRTMYRQRCNHRLKSWRTLCAWIETLPDSHLITGKEPPCQS